MFGVDALSGSPTQLTTGQAAARQALPYEYAGDGTLVVFRAVATDTNSAEIFVVGVNGQALLKLSRNFSEGVNVELFKVSEDGQRVVYSAGNSLFSAPIEGDGDVLISDSTELTDGVLSFAITKDSSKVIYSAKTGPGLFDISTFITDIHTGNSELISPLNNGFSNFEVPDDGAFLVSARLASNFASFDLFILDLNSGSIRKIDAGPTSQEPSFELTSNSKYLIYRIFDSAETKLFAVDFKGGKSIEITQAISQVAFGFLTSGNGRYVLFDAVRSGVSSLFSFDLESLNEFGESCFVVPAANSRTVNFCL